MLTIDCLQPELIKVCLTEHGLTNCCYVTSHHLAAEKEKQLRNANLRDAVQALN